MQRPVALERPINVTQFVCEFRKPTNWWIALVVRLIVDVYIGLFYHSVRALAEDQKFELEFNSQKRSRKSSTQRWMLLNKDGLAKALF